MPRSDTLLAKAANRLVVGPRQRAPRHGTVALRMSVDKPSRPDAEQMFFAHYEERFSSEEYCSALGDLLDRDTPTETLLLFAHMFQLPLAERFYAVLQKRTVSSPEGYLYLGEYYHSRKRDEEACDALVRAKALLRTRGECTSLQSRIRGLAKRIGREGLGKSPIGAEVFRQVGFTEITNRDEPVQREIELDESLVAFEEGEDGTIRTAAVRIQPNTNPTCEVPFELAYVVSDGNGRAWGSGGSQSSKGKWSASHGAGLARFHASIRAVQTGASRFQVTIVFRDQ